MINTGEHPSEQKNAKNHQKTRKRSLRGISLLKKLARDQTFKKFIAKSDATSMNRNGKKDCMRDCN